MKFDIAFRPFCLSDACFVNNLRRDEGSEELIGSNKRPVSLERDTKWIEDLIMKDDQSKIYFAITGLFNEKIIGYTSISNIDYRNGSCFWSGLKIERNFSGKGYGKQTTLKILKFVFEELRMERCTAECLEQHAIALKMMLSSGFKQEGLMRNSIFKNGVFNSQFLLSMIREEYLQIKENFQL
jgi:[ribosomal protein S5]-alanine N-acetyltransferase